MLTFGIDKNGSIYIVLSVQAELSLELHHTSLFIQNDRKGGCEDRNGFDIVRGTKSRLA